MLAQVDNLYMKILICRIVFANCIGSYKKVYKKVQITESIAMVSSEDNQMFCNLRLQISCCTIENGLMESMMIKDGHDKQWRLVNF